MSNGNLHQAKKAKNDEFYTQLSDIEKELRHYREHFRDKVVFCNCDDARESNFFKYFSTNFEFLGLRRLVTIGYKENGKGVLYIYEGDKNGNGVIDPEELQVTELQGDGDFRSDESIELLKDCDIVVTNPPFSLFREYVTQLMEYGKDFIVIGSKNAISYKEIFPLIKDNKLWLGYNSPSEFITPTDGISEPSNVTKLLSGLTRWFTNLTNSKRNEELILCKKYTSEEYPKYENFDAINVNKVVDIPIDYDGVMGVPITFLDKYNPKQFNIIGLGIANLGLSIGVKPYKEEHRKYRKEIQKRGTVDGDLYLLNSNGEVEVPYARILIRKIQ